eukprot:s31_g14.t1
MEPSAEELNQIETLDAAYDWAGVPADVRTSLNAALGAPAKIRDIIFVPRTVWDTIVGRTKGKGPPGSDGVQPDRDLTAIDLARIGIFRRVCFRRIGVTPDTPGNLGPPVPSVTAAAPAALTSSSPSRKLKMSAVVDQTLDAEIEPLGVEAVNRVHQLVRSKSVPYIDFAVFGPNGLRLLRRLTFQAISLNSQGEWQRKEMPGPPDYDSWYHIYRCVRTTFLLLETISAERMDAYAEHIRQLALRFGPHCWDLVYTADVHMRSEQFERIRRKLHASPEHGYTEAEPWSAVMAQAIKEDAFWTKEVVTPATLRLAQSRSIPAPLGPGGKAGVLPDSEATPAPARKKRKKVKEADDKSKQDGKAAPPVPSRGDVATGEEDSKPGNFQGERYGCWSRDPSKLGKRPRCLHLFSGPQRPGDLADQLTHLGWAVCSCDILQPLPTDLLDQAVRQAIFEDVEMQVYDAVFLGTPCETYSALREIQPGPKPLRSPTELMGIKEGLSPSERKQLKEGNEHTEFSAQVMKKAHKTYVPFGVENPEPLNPVSIFSTPWFTAVAGLKNVRNADFDQCRVGCEAKKPTRLMSYRIDFRKLNGQRCNHEVKKFMDAKGNEYSAAHERVAQRRRKRSDGTEEYASKALGNYPSEFCKEIADAISKVNMERAMKRRELRDQEMP